MSPLPDLAAELRELEAEGLLREPRRRAPGALLLCTNDYLGLAAEPLGVDGPGGCGASRLIAGDHDELLAAEEALADWVGLEAALIFASGYAANVGVMSAIAGRGDVIVSDALNHASIIDGCRLSRAEVKVAPHRSLEDVERALVASKSARRRWVVTESYFSMDGDSPNLRGLRELCDAHGAGLVVDEAHALGVFGDQGRGLCADAGVEPDILIGTLGKAVGLAGAFVAGSALLRRFLWNRARSFVFSTGFSPALARAVQPRVERVRRSDEARRRLRDLGQAFRVALEEAGAPVAASSHGPILPWMVGASAEAVAMSERLEQAGVVVTAIRPPTVPSGTARLRITLHAKLSDEDRDRAIAALVARRS